MPASHTIAYLAGALDADGYFGIKRSTYQTRVLGVGINANYEERIGLKQVTEIVPLLLKETFGGHVGTTKPSSEHGRLLYGWSCSDRVAASAAARLRPYIRIKRVQADALLELRSWKSNADAQRFAWWWEREHPDWRDMAMLTGEEASAILGYRETRNITQALRNKTLIALPTQRTGSIPNHRFPEPLIRALAALRSKRGRYTTPPQLIAVYEELAERVRRLNTIGTGDHPITMRTGPYQPAA